MVVLEVEDVAGVRVLQCATLHLTPFTVSVGGSTSFTVNHIRPMQDIGSVHVGAPLSSYSPLAPASAACRCCIGRCLHPPARPLAQGVTGERAVCTCAPAFLRVAIGSVLRRPLRPNVPSRVVGLGGGVCVDSQEVLSPNNLRPVAVVLSVGAALAFLWYFTRDVHSPERLSALRRVVYGKVRDWGGGEAGATG